MTAVGVLTSKLQEACIQGADDGPGLKCKWTPNGATTGLYLYMILGQVTDLPVTVADGWFANRPVLTVAFTCKPFLSYTPMRSSVRRRRALIRCSLSM